METRLKMLLPAALGVFAFTSCASGPAYPDVKSSGAIAPRGGKGMVLVYRTRGFAGAGSKPYVWVNNQKLPGQLARGGFYTFDASPGAARAEYAWNEHPHSVGESLLKGGLVGLAGDQWVGNKRQGVDLHVSAGQTSYVEMDGRNLLEHSKTEAEEGLADCHWLNPR